MPKSIADPPISFNHIRGSTPAVGEVLPNAREKWLNRGRVSQVGVSRDKNTVRALETREAFRGTEAEHPTNQALSINLQEAGSSRG